MNNSNTEQTIQSQPPPEQNNQPKPPVHSHSRTFYIILVILGIILLLSMLSIAVYFIGTRTTLNHQKQTSNLTKIPSPAPTIDPTTNWKTYNSNSGFSFKYPTLWIIPQQCHFGTECVASADMIEKTNKTGEGGGNMIISKGGVLGITRKDRTPEIKLEDSCQPGGSIYVNSCTSTTIDGRNTIQRIDGNPEDSTVFFILTDKYFYTIALNYVQADKLTKNALDQILSTFKFTDQNQNLTPTPILHPKASVP